VGKKRYTVCLHGCTDDTCFDIELTDSEKELVDRLVELSKSEAIYCCLPFMSIEQIREDA